MIKMTTQMTPGDIIKPEDVGLNCTCSHEKKNNVITKMILFKDTLLTLVRVRLGYHKCQYKNASQECAGSYIQQSEKD
jgi:hypothetical protein